MKTIDRQHFIRKFAVLNFVLFFIVMASSVQVVAQCYHEPCDPELERKYNEEYLLDCGGLVSDIGHCGDAHLPKCIELADFIFEANVINKEVVYGKNDTQDTYTIMYLEVTKIFKGQVSDTIALIMEGGYMGIPIKRGNYLTIPTSDSYPNLISFENDFIGIFFGKSNEYQLLNLTSYQSINLIKKANIGYNHPIIDNINQKKMPWEKVTKKEKKFIYDLYEEIGERFYNPIQNLVGKKMEVRREWFVVPKKGGAAQKEAAGSEFEIFDLVFLQQPLFYSTNVLSCIHQ